MHYKILFVSLLLLCFSCQGDQDKTAVNIADDICSCFKPLVEVNNEIQSMIKNGKEDEAESLMKKVEEVNAESQKCSMDMVTKYGADTELDTKKISASMKTKCPKILKIVEPILFAPK